MASSDLRDFCRGGRGGGGRGVGHGQWGRRGRPPMGGRRPRERARYLFPHLRLSHLAPVVADDHVDFLLVVLLVAPRQSAVA